MNVPTLLSRLWRGKKKDEETSSIVLLLRRPRFFSKKELEVAGEKGFHRPFGEEGSMYFVVQDAPVTLIKAGTKVINVLHASQPYLADVAYVAAQLSREEQRKAWLQHSAWAALSLWNRDTSRKEAYDALARFALHLGDDNCCGVYLPKEQMMMPNDGTAEQALRMMIEQELPFSRS